jgi:hypothetical protein
MKHRSRAGLSEVLVVIVALAAILLAVPAVVLYNQIAAKAKVQAELRAEIKHLTGVEQARRNALQEAVEKGASGFDPQKDTNDYVARALAAAKEIEAFRVGTAPTTAPAAAMPEAAPAAPPNAPPAPGDQEGATPAPTPAPAAQALPDYWTKFHEQFMDETQLKQLGRPATLELMVMAMIGPVAKVQLQEKVSRARELTAAKELEVAKAIADKPAGGTLSKLAEPYENLITLLEADLKAITDAQKLEDENHPRKIEGINKEIQDMDAKLEENKLAQARLERDKKTLIAQLTGKLEEFKRREAINFARIRDVGEVFHTSTDGRTAMIRLGSRDRLKTGMRFRVGNRGLHGAITDKATVEVRQIWPEMAEVEVVRTADATTRVLSGDRLVNPFYHPRRAVVVRLLGEETVPGAGVKLSKSRAAQRIEALGGIVRPRFTPDVDLVILMSEEMVAPEDVEDREAARVTNVPTYSAREMFGYLEE